MERRNSTLTDQPATADHPGLSGQLAPADLIRQAVTDLHHPADRTIAGDPGPNCAVCEYGNQWPCESWKAAQENPPAVARITLLHHATSEGFCWTCSYMTEWPCSTFNAATSGDGIRYIRETI